MNFYKKLGEIRPNQLITTYGPGSIMDAVNDSLTDTDKKFLLSFEDGTPDWNKCCAGDLSNYPSVKWKLQNIGKLKNNNPQKHQQGIGKLMLFFGNQRK